MPAKPVIFTVDDDPSVLRAVATDLRRKYGSEYRILRADSGQAALDALRELKARQDPVALFLVDQRMPGISGTELLIQAVQFYPNARRVLLTAYADTEAAIQAINNAGIDYYLLKPWDPPEEKLYPVLDDLLDDWQAGYRPPFEGIRVLGHRWSPETHDMKEFLARNQIPYLYLDLEQDKEAKEILEQLQLAERPLPLVMMPDGETLRDPEHLTVAQKIGLQTQADEPFYDLAIVGGGPAGLAAAVYGASEGLSTVLIERHATGGQAGTSSRIENYLGFPSGLPGAELARRATTQARRFGVEILNPQEATHLAIEEPYKKLTLADGAEIACHSLVLAVGLEYRNLDIPGIDRLVGAGVYYGASNTEVNMCRTQPVFVVGAGNSAGQAAIYLADNTAQVNMLVRSGKLGDKMSQYLVDRIEQHPNIQVHLDTEVVDLHGGDHLEAVTLRHHPAGEEERREAVALFIFIGAIPCTGWLQGKLALDKYGFILSGPQVERIEKGPFRWKLERPPYLLETSTPGIFVVGDARAGSVKRVASAVGEGSIAVQFVHQYLAHLK